MRGEQLNAVEQAGVPIYYEKKCVGISQESNEGVTLEFQDGEMVQASFVVGADGIHSPIRTHVAGGPSAPTYQGHVSISGACDALTLEALQNSNHGLRLPGMFVGQSGTFTIFPYNHDGQQMSFFTSFDVPEPRTLEEWASFDADKVGLKKLLMRNFCPASSVGKQSDWHPIVVSACRNVDEQTLRT